MIAGHFGLAAVVKSRAPQVPLWALMLGSVWLDVVFVPLLFAQVETIEPLAGTQGGYGDVVIHANYTHSVVGALALSALFGLVGWRWGRGAVLALSAVAFSHWVLDLPMHHHDLSWLPGQTGSLGLGLWSSPMLSMALELSLVAAGALLYWRAARRIAGKRSTVPSLALLASGLVTLGLNVAGI